MNSTRTTVGTMGAARNLHGFVMLAAVGTLTVVFAPLNICAQNAAQRTALARLVRGHANSAPASGVEATIIPLDRPHGLAFDATGNLYIADTDDNVIREVSVAGIISTVAGDGEQGFGGDGGSATSALLDTPTGVAVDANGNLYIADSHNNRIREVSGGVISTIAGTGVAGFAGDGGPATAAKLDLPSAVGVDAKGDVYIADANNNRIREVSSMTITTVAGNGEQTYSGDGGPATAAGINSPTGVAVDVSSNIYIGDTQNQRIRMVTSSTGIISTLAGTGVRGFTADGPAAAAALARPSGVAVDVSGTVYVADSDNNRIRTINGSAIATIAGNGAEGFTGDAGASISASLDTPRAVAVNYGAVLLSDTDNNRVREVSGGTINSTAGQPSSSAEILLIGSAVSTVYGTGSLTATFSNAGLTGTGLVTFFDGEGSSPAMIGQAGLSGNMATISTSALSAGTHYIVASYAGDAKNPAITSGIYVFVVTPAPLTALANSASMLYGQTVPALGGTLSGVLAQDAGNVTAAFYTTATVTSPPGTYPIRVTLTGAAAANYTVAFGAGSGSVSISRAPSTTTLTFGSATPIFGANVTITATVASTTTGTPTGSINFFNGTAQLNAQPVALSSGVAALTTNTLPVGALSLTAVYSGDTDFTASTSGIVTERNLSPDFTIAASPGTQTLLPSQSVKYQIALTPANPTFVYPVSLSVSGLPVGVTASFAPSSIASGAAASTTVLTLSASSVAASQKDKGPFGSLPSHTTLTLILIPVIFNRRFRRKSVKLGQIAGLAIAVLSVAVAAAITGCGGGAGFFAHSTKTYTVTVTAVSGPDTHTSDVILTVH